MQTAKNSSPKIKYVFTFLVQSSASFANHMFNSNNDKENVTKLIELTFSQTTTSIQIRI